MPGRVWHSSDVAIIITNVQLVANKLKTLVDSAVVANVAAGTATFESTLYRFLDDSFLFIYFCQHIQIQYYSILKVQSKVSEMW